MKKFDHPLLECPKCDGVNMEETETFYDTDMVQIIRCNDCGFSWEEHWAFSSSIVSDEE